MSTFSSADGFKAKKATVKLAYVHEGKDIVFDSTRDQIVIGRGKVDMSLAFALEVSRHHVRIFLENGVFFVEDLNSRWGTTLNGVEIKEKGRKVLHEGDKITVSKVEITVLKLEVQKAPEDEGKTCITTSYNAKMPTAIPIEGCSPEIARRLHVLFELPLKLSAALKLDDVLMTLVTELLRVIPKAKQSALVLKECDGDGLILKAWLPEEEPGFSTTLAVRAMTRKEGFIWRSDEIEDLTSTGGNDKAASGMYAPVIWHDKVLGAVCVNSPLKTEEFTQEDLKLLAAMVHYGAMAVENFLVQEDLRRHADLMNRMISCRFSPDVRKKLMHDAVMDLIPLGTRKSHICVLASDIRGFTKLSAEIGAQKTSDLLNEFFPPLIDAIHANKGTVERFVGDAIFAVFGTPESDDHQHEHAVRAALAMQTAAAEIMRKREARQLEVCQIGIGIDCGDALHGFIGNANRLEFAVIGTPANFASRYCNGAGKGELMISPEVYARVFNKFRCERTTIETKHEGSFPAWRVKGAV